MTKPSLDSPVVAERTEPAVSPTRNQAGRARMNWYVAAPFVVLMLLIVGFSIGSPIFFTPDNLLNIMQSSAVLLVLALGTTVVMLTGSIDLSIGSVLTLSAYVAAIAAQSAGTTAAVLLAPLVGLVCGALNGALISYARLPSFLVTLGGYFAFDGLAGYLSDGQPLGLAYGGVAESFGGSVGGIPVISLWAIGLLVLVVIAARYTRFGRYIYAVGGNERTARLTGIPVRRIKLYVFLLSGVLAGAAALLQLVRTASASPGMGEPFLLLAIGAVVMGGTSLSGGSGGPVHSITGVLVIAILANGMVLANVNPYAQNVIIGVVVVAAVALTMKRTRDSVVK